MGWHGDVARDGSPSVLRMEDDITANGYRIHEDMVTMKASQLPVPSGQYALRHQIAENKQRVRERLSSHTQWLLTALETRFPDYGLVSSFTILTPDAYLRIKQLADTKQLDAHGKADIMTLLAHFGKPKQLDDGTIVEAMMVDYDSSLVEFFLCSRLSCTACRKTEFKPF